MLRIALLLMLSLVALPAAALQSAPLNSEDLRLGLAPYTSYYEDRSGSLQHAEVSTLPDSAFRPVTGEQLNMGKNNSVWWLQIRLDNRLAKALNGILEVNYPMLDSLQLYHDRASDSRQPQVSGDTLAYAQRPIKVRNFWFPLELPPGENRLLLRVETSSTVFVPLLFSTQSANAAEHELQTGITGTFYGVLIGLFCYNLFLFISLRERVYFWYLTYSLMVALQAASYDGVLFSLLPSPALQSVSVYISMYLCAVTALYFSRHFLDTRQHFPRMDLLLRLGALFGLLCLLAQPLIGMQPWNILAGLFVLTTWLVLMLCGAYVRLHGLRHGTYYLLAWGLLLCWQFFVMSGSLGLEFVFSYHPDSIKLANALVLIVISIGLAERINLLKEESFRARQNAVQATSESLAKTRWLARMSHEIRTPLNGLLGTLQLLRQTDLERSQRFYLDTVLSTGDALLAVINNLIDYARIESGRIALEHIEFDLESLLSDCLNLFTAQARDKQLQLYMSMQPGVPRYIKGDPTRLRQVLMNLLGNAVKFTSRGHVSLQVELAQTTNGRTQLRFSITDSGIGIDSQAFDQLFRSFSQADSSTARHYGGSGLGLVISKELVELMGGSIAAQSLPGQGSCFSFMLDLDSPAATASDPLAALAGRRALLASEDERGLEVLTQLLERWGLQCSTCSHPQQLSDALLHMPCPALLVLMTPWPDAVEEWIDSLLPQLKPGTALLLLCPPELRQQLPPSAMLKLYCQPLPLSVSGLRAALEELYDSVASLPAMPAPRRAGQQILLAEDNPVNQIVIQGLLRHLGYTSLLSSDGRQAVDAYSRDPAAIGLILMDCEMPQLDGFAATKEIREFERQRGLAAVPIIALTAHPLDEQRQTGLQAGMNDLLGKPINTPLLQGTLEKYLGKPLGAE